MKALALLALLGAGCMTVRGADGVVCRVPDLATQSDKILEYRGKVMVDVFSDDWSVDLVDGGSIKLGALTGRCIPFGDKFKR